MTWLQAIGFPLIGYALTIVTSFWPLGLIFLAALVGMVAAVVIATRESYPAAWWVVVPLVITHAVVLLPSTSNAPILLGVELVAIGGLIWLNRDNKIIAALLAIFSTVYAFFPFVFGLGLVAI
ncbi:MAG: hypothetical protein ABIQ30_14800 [Devosia sp.]